MNGQDTVLDANPNTRLSIMDADCVNKFVEATLHILETTAATTVKAKKPYLKREGTAAGAVTGLINIEGDFKGSVAVSFSEKLILHVVSTLFGEEITELNDEIKDAVGEITNMISGQATTKLTEMGKTLKATLSSVLMEDGHVIPHIENRPVIAMPYVAENGEILLELCFDE